MHNSYSSVEIILCVCMCVCAYELARVFTRVDTYNQGGKPIYVQGRFNKLANLV